ncbi:ATP-binding protein [Deinococcus sp. SM5_A1]|uniref:sensor histidine kinase n=1 Tax=Deinococcus sp. SM5_A1 TaxID=3379094 RepID=UPI003859F27B
MGCGDVPRDLALGIVSDGDAPQGTQPGRLNAYVVGGGRHHPSDVPFGGTLPTVMGDAGLLRRVVTALVGNAVKYIRGQERAVIEVWAEDRGQSWTVLVRDNGVGFNPQYGDKLFTMFQRLHWQEDFGGAAVSLANARRIVARHGGTVTAEGQLGVGATFGFSLPKASP